MWSLAKNYAQHVERKCIFGFKGTSTSKVIGARNEMMMDDYDGQMIFGDLVGLKLPDIRLTGEEKTSPRKLVPTGDRTRACCVTSAHATTCSTAVDVERKWKNQKEASAVPSPSSVSDPDDEVVVSEKMNSSLTAIGLSPVKIPRLTSKDSHVTNLCLEWSDVYIHTHLKHGIGSGSATMDQRKDFWFCNACTTFQ